MAPNIWNHQTGTPQADHLQGQVDSSARLFPDLKKEFDDLIVGVAGEQGIGQFLLLRLFDRTQKVPGYDSVRGASSDDPWDQGDIYQWNEIWVLGHFTQSFGRSLTDPRLANKLREAGFFDEDKALVYLQAGNEVKTGDALFRVRQTEEGSAYYPLERIEKWRIVNVEDRRQEKRKVAFYICSCERVEV